MKNFKLKESPLFWPAHFEGKTLFVLDETLIPAKVKYLPVTNTAEAVKVIREMKTRAFGQLLVVLNTFLLELRRQPLSDAELLLKIHKIAKSLNDSRPTFPFAEVTGMVVFWAMEAQKTHQDIAVVLEKNINGYLQGIRVRRLERVQKIAALIKDGDSVLTHCNVSGELAMAAAICLEQGKRVQFFASETRPYLQGAKLTAWELKRLGAKVILVADNAVGSLMADGLVNKVIVGSDRNCANSDFANKIGTYQLAVLAKEFNIPFYVLTQPSNRVATGAEIPIEVRNEKELLCFQGRKIFKEKVHGFYPGFDVVPHELITGTIPIEVSRNSSSENRNSKKITRIKPAKPQTQSFEGIKPRSIILLLGAFESKFYDFILRQGKGEDLQYFVLEGRPDFAAARATCQQLLKRKITPVVIADNTAGFLFARNLVKEVWVAFQTLDEEDVLADSGALILGVLAKNHRVPLFAFSGMTKTRFVGSPDALCSLNGLRVAPAGIKGYVPFIELLPKQFVKKIYTKVN